MVTPFSPKFRSRLVRNYRKLSWQLRSNSCIPLHWHTGRPNFGDDANPRLFEAIANMSRRQGQKLRIRFAKQSEPHLLGMGSVLWKSGEHSTVWGSGFIAPYDRPPLKYGKIVAVRGRLTIQDLGIDAPDILLGDPMVLINFILEKPQKRDIDIGLVPHEANILPYMTKYSRRFEIIDPRDEPFKVISKIAKCRAVISQSLHGLIVADAMEVPNVWLEPTDNIMGGQHKFLDYFSTVIGAKNYFSIIQLDEENPPINDYCVRQFCFDKHNLLWGLGEAIHDFGDMRKS